MFSALPPWKPYNKIYPSEHELVSAATIEEYYNLKEPRSIRRSLDSDFFYKHSISTAVTYLDKRLPSIRNVFRKTFEEACPVAPEVLDKKAIDRMITLFRSTEKEVTYTILDMISESYLETATKEKNKLFSAKKE